MTPTAFGDEWSDRVGGEFEQFEEDFFMPNEQLGVREKALEEAIAAVKKRALEIDHKECCGHGVQTSYDEPHECCGDPIYMISDVDAVEAIRSLILEQSPTDQKDGKAEGRASETNHPDCTVHGRTP